MPPIVQKQSPNGKVVPQVVSKPGSLLSKAVDVSSLTNNKVKLTLYGQNRVGKSTMACQFPKPLLFLSFEPNKTGGAASITKIPGVSAILVKYSKQRDDPPNCIYGTDAVKKLVEELKLDNQYKTVVVDSATSFQDLYLQEILQVDQLPEQMSFGGITGENYRNRSEKIKEGLRPFLNLDKHVIITAKEKDHNPPKEEKVSASGKKSPDMRAKFLRGMNQESYVAADLGGSAVGWLHDCCDYIGRLYLAKEVIVTKSTRTIMGKEKEFETEEETGYIIHRIRTMYHPNFAAGFRSPDPDSIPEYVEGKTPKALYDELMRVINGSGK